MEGAQTNSNNSRTLPARPSRWTPATPSRTTASCRCATCSYTATATASWKLWRVRHRRVCMHTCIHAARAGFCSYAHHRRPTSWAAAYSYCDVFISGSGGWRIFDYNVQAGTHGRVPYARNAAPVRPGMYIVLGADCARVELVVDAAPVRRRVLTPQRVRPRPLPYFQLALMFLRPSSRKTSGSPGQESATACAVSSPAGASRRLRASRSRTSSRARMQPRSVVVHPFLRVVDSGNSGAKGGSTRWSVTLTRCRTCSR